ncbi:MAG: hypothetical protein ACK550_11440 [Synechococcaceae cyanobacterium]|jgi:hypothetical protein
MPDFGTPMPSTQDQAQDAILYIQGLDVQPLEQTAHRIASAFEACSVSARSAYMVNAGHEEEYSTTKAARLKSKVFTIQKRNSDGSSKNIIDLYEFEYIDALTKSGKDGNLIVKTLRVAIQLVVNVPRLWNAFVRRKSQKTLMDRLQFVYASCIMLLLVVYLGVLLTAVYDTMTHAFSKLPVGNAQSSAQTAINRPGHTTQTQGMLAQAEQLAPPPRQAQAGPPGSAILQAAGELTRLIGNWAPSLVIVTAVVEAFYPDLKQKVLDAAFDYSSALDYLSFGSRGTVLDGHLISLLDHIEAKGYQNLDVVAYSFGSILAIDCFFPANQPPAERVKGVGKLITVGCPFDMIRVFWPQYYADRRSWGNLGNNWINIYSPIDILGSNFRNDAELLAPDEDTAFCLTGGMRPYLCPSQNIIWTAGRSKKGMTTLEFLALVGLEAHQSYWGHQEEGESTAFKMIISELYGGSEYLA